MSDSSSFCQFSRSGIDGSMLNESSEERIDLTSDQLCCIVFCFVRNPLFLIIEMIERNSTRFSRNRRWSNHSACSIGLAFDGIGRYSIFTFVCHQGESEDTHINLIELNLLSVAFNEEKQVRSLRRDAWWFRLAYQIRHDAAAAAANADDDDVRREEKRRERLILFTLECLIILPKISNTYVCWTTSNNPSINKS